MMNTSYDSFDNPRHSNQRETLNKSANDIRGIRNLVPVSYKDTQRPSIPKLERTRESSRNSNHDINQIWVGNQIIGDKNQIFNNGSINTSKSLNSALRDMK
jgi:hypothetical protein